MTPAERKTHKREARQIIARRSEAWARATREANPAPLGSDLWMKNHLRAHENEVWLRTTRPDWIPAGEVRRRFVLISSEETGQPEPYAHCKTCGDILYSAPATTVSCTCGNITISHLKKRGKINTPDQAQNVHLVPKGAENEV